MDDVKSVSSGENESFDNDPGMDELFKKFFGITDEYPENDKLSLLACNRQGITADELLYRPQSYFGGRNVPVEKEMLRYEEYERRRRAKFAVVEAERKALVMQLFQKSTQLTPRRKKAVISQADQQFALMELGKMTTTVDGDSTGRPLTPVTELLQSSQFSPKKRPPVILHANKYDTNERLRQREMKQVERELFLEIAREEMTANMDAKEERRKILQAKKRQIQAMEATERHEQTMTKLMRLQDMNDNIEAAKRRKGEELERKRKEKEERRREEQARQKAEKAQFLVNKLYTVYERNKLVQQSTQSRCDMQLKDMAHKQQLHYERRKNIQLHRETLQELNKIKTLQKAIAIHEASERRMHEEELWKHQLLEKHASAEERIEVQKLHEDAIIREKRMWLEAKERKRLELKSIADLKFQDNINAVLIKHHKKENHVRLQKMVNSTDQDLRAEKKLLRIQNWVDNKHRIERVDEYKEMVRASKIEADQKRTEELLAERTRMTEERQRIKKATQLEKEKLLKEVAALKQSANPRSFLASHKLDQSLPDAFNNSVSSHRSHSVPLQQRRDYNGDSRGVSMDENSKLSYADNEAMQSLHALSSSDIEEMAESDQESKRRRPRSSEPGSANSSQRCSRPSSSTRSVQRQDVRNNINASLPGIDHEPDDPHFDTITKHGPAARNRPWTPMSGPSPQRSADELGGGPKEPNAIQIYLTPQNRTSIAGRNLEICVKIQRAADATK